jgi:hypothetical protein
MAKKRWWECGNSVVFWWWRRGAWQADFARLKMCHVSAFNFPFFHHGIT